MIFKPVKLVTIFIFFYITYTGLADNESIRIETSDKVTFVLPNRLAIKSNVLLNTIETCIDTDDKPIPLFGISSNEWLFIHNALENSPPKIREAHLSCSQIIKILKASNFLDIPDLYRSTIKIISENIEDFLKDLSWSDLAPELKDAILNDLSYNKILFLKRKYSSKHWYEYLWMKAFETYHNISAEELLVDLNLAEKKHRGKKEYLDILQNIRGIR